MSALDSPTRLPAFPEVQALAAGEMAAVDALIRERLSSDVVLINQISEHIVAAGGKRLRPLLSVIAARALGYEGTAHHQLAAIVEFIHTSTLLHDAAARPPMRSGATRPACWWATSCTRAASS